MKNSLLWRIGKNNIKESYLFGTIHIYDSSIFQIPDIIYRLIDSVDTYSPESDNRHISYSDMISNMTVSDSGYSLKNYLNEECYNNILEISDIDSEIFDTYKPFFLSTFVLSDDDMPSSSIDAELLAYAQITDKTIIEMESFAEQIQAVDLIPYNEQAAIIEKSIATLGKKSDFTQLMLDYKMQDIQALKRSLEEMAPAQIFIDSIQKNRNVVMADKIDSIINNGFSSFTAVGALHIPDTPDVKGIVTLLQEKGYDMQPVEFTFNI